MPPAATVESAFVVLDRASGPIRSIRREARELRLEAERAGRALDGMSDSRDLREWEAFSRTTRASARALREVKQEARAAAPALLTYTQRLSSAHRETERLARATDRLAVALERLGAVDARPRVNVDGLLQARAEVAALRRELRALSGSRGTATVGVRRIGLGGGGFGGGGGGRGGAAAGGFAGAAAASGLRGVDFGPFSLRPGVGLALYTAAVPVGQALLGGAGAAATPLATGTLGLGAVGGAGLGVFASGLGGLVSVLAPARQGLKELADAQKKYNEAVEDYGRASLQAARAQRELRQAERGAPVGGASLIRQRTLLAQDWTRLTRPGQGALLGAGTSFLRGVRSRAPFLAGQANVVSRAFAAQGRQFGDFLMAPQQMLVLRRLTNQFANDLGYAENTAENLVTTFGNLSRAALPFFHDGMQFLERWTQGWATSTSDISQTRRQIAGYVDDLRLVARVTGNAAQLVQSLFAPARGPGRGLLEEFNETLIRWDAWAQRNPDRIRSFFDGAVDSTRTLARFLGASVQELHRLADVLGPVVDRFLDLASLAGGNGLLLPVAIRAGMRLGSRGGGGGGGGGAPSGGGAPMVAPVALGAGAAGAAVAGAAASSFLTMRRPGVAGRFSTGAQVLRPEMFQERFGRIEGARFGMPESTLGPRPTLTERALGRAGSAAATAGRFVGPTMLIAGALGAATTRGPWYEVLSSGVNAATLGLVPVTRGPESLRLMGRERALGMLSGLPAGQDEATLRRNIARIERRLERARRAAGRGGQRPGFFTLDFNLLDLFAPNQEAAAAAGEIAALEEALAGERATLGDVRAGRRAVLEERSRLHGAALADSLQQAFVTRTTRGPKAERLSPERAMEVVLHDTFMRMRAMKDEGAKVLGETMLEWAEAMERENPKVKGAVDDLTRYIRRRWSDLGRHIQVVDGRILTGTAREWNAISRALTDPAEVAVQRVKDAFTDLQRQAVGSLMAMGYSRREANQLVRAMETGGRRGFVRTQSGISAMHGDTAASRGSTGGRRGQGRVGVFAGSALTPPGPSGDGIGDGPGDDLVLHGAGASARFSGARSAASTGLAGADPSMAHYAQLAASFGARVTSGLRPGAVTRSGNRSYHASGHALDFAGGNLVALAHAIAERYGAGIEEMIYSPLGWGIKNGRRVPLSFFGPDVIRDHYDHLHVADVDPQHGRGGLSVPFSPDTAGPGLQQIKLDPPDLGLGGVPGALADAAARAITEGLERKLNEGLIGAGMFLGGGGLTSAGGRFDRAALANLWVRAGGPPQVAELMAAIALAESSGDPFARNPSGASGLWQILGLPSPGNPFDPLTNARMAVEKYRSQGLRAWEAYTRGMHRRFMGDGGGMSRLLSKVRFASEPAASSGGRGPTVVNFTAHVHTGMNRSQLKAEFARFADEVFELVANGPEESPAELIS